MSTIGKHCILELYGCSPEMLNDPDGLLAAMKHAATSAGATWLDSVCHHFNPQGVTALGLLAESHISIHTWPELGYASADVFTCGDHTDPKLACEILAKAVGAASIELRSFERAARFTGADLTPAGVIREPLTTSTRA